ncbi:MAG: threonine/serine dehydratase [Pseudomonadota bacterium]
MTTPTADDVLSAVERVAPFASETPLLRNDALDAAVGAKVWIKPENLQVTGSFKIRGAANRLTQLGEAERRAGVVAYSSGNHAQGISRAARMLDIPATIVMPSDAPGVKIEGVKRDGARIVTYDRWGESRETIAAQICEEAGAILVPSYDDPHILAGQGTAGVELARQVQSIGAHLDHVICCIGGGGLIGGLALAFEVLSPSTRIWGAEPEHYDDWLRSLEGGTVVANRRDAPASLCDSILTPQPGDITWSVGRSRIAGGFRVSDGEVAAAMRFAFRHMKLVVEPGGSAALAAALYRRPKAWLGQSVGLLLTGGNVDPDLYARAISGEIPGPDLR